MQKESGTPGRARGDERGNGGNSPKSVSLRYLSTSPNTFAPCTCPDAPVRSPLRALSPMPARQVPKTRSEEHTSELQSLMRISYAVFCLKKKKTKNNKNKIIIKHI